MTQPIIFDSPDNLLKRAFNQSPQAREAMMKAAKIKGKLLPYQAAMLYTLVEPYNREGVSILEIGTFVGYSAAIMAQAAPLAQIVTLNPAKNEYDEAVSNLANFRNVHLVNETSWGFLESTPDLYQPDIIFVDGDHNQIARDMPWWDRLNVGGLMIFHDYSEKACPPVYEAVNGLADALYRPKPNIVVVDSDLNGMAAFNKGEKDGKLLYG